MNKFKKTQLVKPTMLQIVFGVAVFFLKKHTPPKVIPHISQYTHISSIKKDAFKNFSLGIYTDGEEKVFIKTWTGRVKDFKYYSLVNEYFVSPILRKKFAESGYKDRIFVPEVKDVVVGEYSLSVVFEYIDGAHLDNFPIERQEEVLREICEAFAKISLSLTDEEKSHFTKRTLPFYILSLPFLLGMVGAKNPRKFPLAFRYALKNILGARSLVGQPLAIAHRDLTPKNICIRKGKAYVFDCEGVVMTLPSYDLLQIKTVPEFSGFAALSPLRTLHSGFLFMFITLHTLVNVKNVPSWQEYLVPIITKSV
ncbi:MAG: hypothetical protein UY07_C0008G0012 [Parcubacteria group bacterium GW2011_GWA1_47_8]|nr:MAG: hypothetical protein UY07_C0008G0012 [Parcubacteria group bacterium GW2011_GWA1_47_8]